RMLAFRPADGGGEAPRRERPATVPTPAPAPAPQRTAPPMDERSAPRSAPPAAVPPPAAAAAAPVPRRELPRDARGLPLWEALIEQAGLRGPMGQLALNAHLRERDGHTLVMGLQAAHMHLAVEPMVSQMEDRISQALGERIKLRFVSDQSVATHTPAARAANAREEAQSAAEESIDNDPLVQALKREFGAKVVPQSVKPYERP
ncbi:MAG TPA: DNA polymerase III subunit gamma/tau C-terminal domain-containing protein, partial [Dyella sp.]|uniref:DNA polymerase III subunit gamma/tau C-terminal domain-containing protein n=1 Tax=Dyella sp. TaxID=1869338 RepID=UPI002F9365AA